MSQEKIKGELYKNKSWLKEQYIDKDKSIKQISEECGCSKNTIARYKTRFGLRKKNFPESKKKYANKEWLENEYIVKNKMPIEIAEECSVNRGTIFEYINKFSLEKDKAKKSSSYSKRIESISMEKYGVKHFNSSEEVLEKRRLTNLDRYGNETYLGSEEHHSKSDNVTLYGGETLYSISLEHDISNIILYRLASKFPEISRDEIDHFLEDYEKKNTYIEKLISSKASLDIFDQKVDKLSYPDLEYRPGFRINDKVFFNVDGLYWHSECVKEDSRYHFNMRKDFEKRGLRILQFREDEVCQKLDIVLSIIGHLLNKSSRIFARKTNIKKVSHKDAKEFLEKTHLMGSIKARHIGLYYNDELVMVMSYKVNSKNILKIERLSSKLDTVVVGGFSKLLKRCIELTSPETVQYWVDLRYGTGNHLKNYGFEQKRETLGWKWTDFRNTYNRLRCRANMDDRCLTQAEHAAELGWVKIYDAGQRLWEMKL